MSAQRRAAFDQEQARLQKLLGALENVRDPAAKSAARELVQAVMELHGAALADLLAIVREADTQPADTLVPRFVANPKVRSLLLLHDLHPQDLTTRARLAIEHLRPHLAVRGVRVDFVAVDNDVVHVQVAATGQKTQRPSADELRRDIEAALLELAPDAEDLLIEGLQITGGASEAYVPLSSLVDRPRVSAGGE